MCIWNLLVWIQVLCVVLYARGFMLLYEVWHVCAWSSCFHIACIRKIQHLYRSDSILDHHSRFGSTCKWDCCRHAGLFLICTSSVSNFQHHATGFIHQVNHSFAAESQAIQQSSCHTAHASIHTLRCSVMSVFKCCFHDVDTFPIILMSVIIIIISLHESL